MNWSGYDSMSCIRGALGRAPFISAAALQVKSLSMSPNQVSTCIVRGKQTAPKQPQVETRETAGAVRGYGKGARKRETPT